MNLDERQAIRRIVVAIDTSPHSLSALDAAAQMAANLQVELAGLFVEDINLLRTAALPFTREVNRLSGEVRPVDQESIVRQLKSQANQAQAAVEKAALQKQVKCSFRVIRGGVADELVAATEEYDLVALGRTGWSPGQRLGSTAQRVIAQARSQTLLHRPSIGTKSGVVILFDGSVESEKALHYGVQIGHRGEIRVMVLAGDQDEFQSRQSQAESMLKALKRSGVFEHIYTLDELENKMTQQTLVVPITLRESISEKLNRLDCSVLLVR